jgi:hypothetical protein
MELEVNNSGFCIMDFYWVSYELWVNKIWLFSWFQRGSAFSWIIEFFILAEQFWI